MNKGKITEIDMIILLNYFKFRTKIKSIDKRNKKKAVRSPAIKINILHAINMKFIKYKLYFLINFPSII